MAIPTSIGPSGATSFTIAQLSGKKRVLSLAGRALPYRPISFSGTQRAEFTWYTGNPVATMQVLGSEEDETTISGEWKDKFLGTAIDSAFFTTDGQPVIPTAIATVADSSGASTNLTTAWDVTQVANIMRREGQLVAVTWFNVIRHGLIRKFVFSPENIHDIKWEMTFQWISQGDIYYPAAPVTGPAFGDFVQNIAAVAVAIQGIADVVSANASVSRSFVTNLTATINQVNNDITDLSSTLSSIAASTIDPANAAQKGAAQATQAINDLVLLSQGISAVPSTVSSAVYAALPTGANGIPGSPTQNYGQVLSVELSNRNFLKASQQGQAQAAQQRAQLLKQIDVNIIAVFIAQSNTDLRDVSTQYYGTPDDWIQIKTFNQFTSSKLTAGQTVFVPKLNTTPVRQ